MFKIWRRICDFVILINCCGFFWITPKRFTFDPKIENFPQEQLELFMDWLVTLFQQRERLILKIFYQEFPIRILFHFIIVEWLMDLF